MQVRLSELSLENPRQWGACWLADQLWRPLHLDDFFGVRLPVSREDTVWEKVLRILVIYRLLSTTADTPAARSRSTALKVLPLASTAPAYAAARSVVIEPQSRCRRWGIYIRRSWTECRCRSSRRSRKTEIPRVVQSRADH